MEGNSNNSSNNNLNNNLNIDLTFQEQFLKDNSKQDRRKEGQFFTPLECANKLLQIILEQVESKHIFKEINSSLTILEPSVGTGVFIDSWDKFYKEKKIKRQYSLKCIELNQNLYQHVKDKWENINTENNIDNNTENNDTVKNCISVSKDNFLLTPILNNESYHLIIGNPPYFELKKEEKNPYLEFYGDIMQGRPNIYALFIYKCILLLKRSGICGLILSPSFFNGSYFSELRDWMYDKIHILKIEKIENMTGWDTKIPLVYFVFQKKPSTTQSRNRYWFKKNNHLIISLDYNYLNIKFPNNDSLSSNQDSIVYKSISELGCQVTTGNIVWNQRKDKLVSSSINPVNNKLNHIIIYSYNLKNNTIQLVKEDDEKDDNAKKQYYKNELVDANESGVEAELTESELTESELASVEDNFLGLSPPVILVNRVMGSHNKNIKAVLITKDVLKLPQFKGRRMAAENHLNIINVLGNRNYKVKEKILKNIYQNLIQLPSKYLNSISGNSQISSNELAHLIPINNNN